MADTAKEKAEKAAQEKLDAEKAAQEKAKLAEIAAEAKLTAETAKIMESHSLFICNLVASGVKLADAIKRAKNQK